MMSLIQQKFVGNPGHFATSYLTKQINNFSLNTQYFIAIYFIFYGVVNIFLVLFLLKGKLWAYPTAILFLILFIIYQTYRLFVHRSELLLFFTIFDIFLVFLTWVEYKRLQKSMQVNAN